MKNYYEILEVSKNASEDTIKKVFRMLIKKNHPDLYEGDEKAKAEEKVKELNEAYEVLSDSQNRKKYDIELDEFNKNNQDALQILMEENEYLKSVIQEKDNLINQIFKDEGVNINSVNDNNRYNYGNYSREFNYDNEMNNMSNNMTNNVDMTEGYQMYKAEERIRKIISMFFAIVIGMVVLCVVTGVNIFKIIGDVFRLMF